METCCQLLHNLLLLPPLIKHMEWIQLFLSHVGVFEKPFDKFIDKHMNENNKAVAMRSYYSQLGLLLGTRTRSVSNNSINCSLSNRTLGPA